MGRAQASLGLPTLESIRVSDTAVFVGFLLGTALPWLFSSLSIRSVSRAASLVVQEVRKQFRIPGLLEGKVMIERWRQPRRGNRQFTEADLKPGEVQRVPIAIEILVAHH